MNRRSFLAAAGVTLSTSLVGCVQAPGNPATAEPTGTTPGGQPTPDDEPVHDLVVENHTENTLSATIEVLDADDTQVIAGRYELPNRRGIEFADLAAWEGTYTINIAVENGPETSLEWATPECGAAQESPGSGGSRDATVDIEASSEPDGDLQFSLLVDECDAIYGPELPTGPADGFRIDE